MSLTTESGGMGKAPAFQFYAADFLMGTAEMSAVEVGLYIRLLAASWDKGPLPLEPSRLARVAIMEIREFHKAWPVVRAKWTETPDGYVNERLEAQREAQAAFSRRQSDRGKKSGELRRTKNERETNQRSTPVQTVDERETNSSVFSLQSSDQNPDQEPRAVARPAPVDFTTTAEIRNHLRAAAHAVLDANPEATDADIAEAVKDAAAKCRALDYSGREVSKVIDAVRGERARRLA